MRERARRAAAVGFAAALGMLAAACESPPCSLEPSPGINAPKLTEFDVAGQIPTDPYTVVFRVGFEDRDGDLGQGGILFYLNGQASENQVLLADRFRQHGLPLDAQEGEVGVPLRFKETLSDGAQVVIGAQLVDTNEQVSNCGAFNLSFTVTPL